MTRRRRCVLLAAVGLVLLGSCHRERASQPTFTISLPYEISRLDPHARNALSELAVLSHVYEPLVTTDGRMTVKPCLASHWTNPDPLTWVFHLRKAKFHDGQPLRAADVVFTFRRLLDHPELQISGYLADVTSVEALDEGTVRLRTRRPSAIPLTNLRFVLIIPAGSSEASLKTPIGTGPYRFVSFDGSGEIRFTINPEYWGPRPVLTDVTLRLGRSPLEAAEDLVAGRSRLSQVGTRPAEEKALEKPGVLISRQSSVYLKYVGFDHRSPPFSSLALRKAVNLAIDRAELARGLAADAIPATQHVPPTVFGYNPAIKLSAPDPEAARKILLEAYPDGLSVTLHTRHILDDAARIVAGMLEDVGFTVEVVSLDDPEFFRVVKSGEAKLFLSRYGSITGDVSQIFENTMHSIDDVRHFGTSNYGHYANPLVDEKIEASSAILEPRNRLAMLQETGTLAMNDLVWVPLYVDEEVFARDPDVAFTPRNDGMVLAAEIGLARP